MTSPLQTLHQWLPSNVCSSRVMALISSLKPDFLAICHQTHENLIAENWQIRVPFPGQPKVEPSSTRSRRRKAPDTTRTLISRWSTSNGIPHPLFGSPSIPLDCYKDIWIQRMHFSQLNFRNCASRVLPAKLTYALPKTGVCALHQESL